jgi:hypothetical protein
MKFVTKPISYENLKSVIDFLSHKEKLDDDSIINGFKLGDHELCKVLAGFHGDVINQSKPLQEDYKFYCSLNEALRKLYPDCNRWKSIMATMLRINYEQSTAGTPKRLDSVGAPFISYGDLLEIISGTEPLSCLSVEEEQNLRRMCGELKRQYRNPNILKQIKQFESQLSIIAKQEEFRRQNKSFFSQKKDMDYKAGDEYRFNTSHMLRASDEEINAFIKNIKKINNPNLLKLLTINLVRDSIDIIPSEGQHSCLLIAKKFSPIYNAMENRINKLEHSWVNKLGASEKEEMR